MERTPVVTPARDEKRAELIKKELLDAKKIAGIQPPQLIPRGERFRSASTSRPSGAISRELDLPVLRGTANEDFVATMIEPKFTTKPVAAAVEGYRKSALKRAEAALGSLSANRTPALFESIAEQLNLAAIVDPEDADLLRLQAKLNEIRYAGIAFKDEDGTPGGGVKID